MKWLTRGQVRRDGVDLSVEHLPVKGLDVERLDGEWQRSDQHRIHVHTSETKQGWC